MGVGVQLTNLYGSRSSTSASAYRTSQLQSVTRSIMASYNAPSYSSSSRIGGGFSTSPTRAPRYTTPTFPEKIEVTLPWSKPTTKVSVPGALTAPIAGVPFVGSFLGGLEASLENAIGSGGYVNLANAVPWAMERQAVIASEAAKWLTNDDDNFVSQGIDAIGGLLKGVADVVAPVIDWFPNTVRDTMLNQRTMVYSSLVRGQNLGPLESVMSYVLSTVGLNDMSLTMKAQAAGYLDPTQRRIMAEAIDLPSGVKNALNANPFADAAKLLDTEGRAFSYQKGLLGEATNAFGYLSLYLAEAAFTGGLSTVVGGSNALVRGVGTAAKLASTVQKAFLASGLGYFGLTTMVDAVARSMGNEEAVAFFDRINRTTIVSDSVSVQLVSSFAVDPVRAAGMLRKGTLKLAHGGEVVIDTVTRHKLLRLYTTEDRVRRVIATAYRTTLEGADQYIGPSGAYDSWGAATDRVVEWAADHLAATKVIPDSDVRAFHAIKDARQRTIGVMSKYGSQIADLIDTSPRAVASRLWRNWEDHQYAGPFDPRIAAANERDYLVAKIATEKLRTERDMVVGRVDLLGPEGQVRARMEVDDFFARGDEVTLRDLNMLNKDFPAIRGLYRDLVAGKSADEIVSREVFDQVLARAAQKYEDTLRRNPVRAQTGLDPVLRPHSPTASRDMANALGTGEDTVAAIGKAPATWTALEDDAVRAFAREKRIMPDAEASGLPKDQLWERVSQWVDDTTAPWRKEGERVEKVEQEIVRISNRLAELTNFRNERGMVTGTGDYLPEYRVEVNNLRAQKAQLQTLLANVSEPIVPFTQGVRFARREAVNEEAIVRATRKLDAQDRIDTISLIDSQERSWNTISQVSALDMIRPNREGVLAWAGTAPPMSASLYGKLQEFLFQFPGRRTTAARSMPEMGDEELWRWMTEYRNDPGLRQKLTSTQRKMVDRVDVRGSTIDEYQSAWGRSQGNPYVDEDTFLGHLREQRNARDAALSGESMTRLERAAASRPPAWALDEAQARKQAREMGDTTQYDETMWHDPEEMLARDEARQRLAKALDGGDATYPAVREILYGDSILLAQAEELAAAKGMALDDVLATADNAEMLRPLAGSLDDPIVPGSPRSLTDLDDAIFRHDPQGLSDLRAEMDNLRGTVVPPRSNVSRAAAEWLARTPRPSKVLAADIRDAGVHWDEVIPEELWAGEEAAKQAASVILHGQFDFPPRTVRSLLTVLKEIENGNAKNIGIGNDLAAAVQRSAKRIIGNRVGEARKAQVEAGVIGMGRGLSPYTVDDETWQLAVDLFGKHGEKAGIIVRDDMLGLQYGLKQRPSNALVMEMATVPGLAEEMLTGHFQSYAQRLGTAHVRQAYNLVFGPRHNQAIFFEARGRFMDTLAPMGVPEDLAGNIWSAWKKASEDSQILLGRLYASERNIPDSYLNRFARAEVERYYEGSVMPPGLRNLDFAEEFRKATSWTRRTLAGLPMGKALQEAYGFVAHNWISTFFYPLYRFMFDLRFHAQNFFEGPMLYLGRSALRPSRSDFVWDSMRGKPAAFLVEADEGMFGATKQAFTRLAEDGMNDTAMPFSQARASWAYKSFLKEQPDKVRGLMMEDPDSITRAIDSLARFDPELRDTIRLMGDTPEAYMAGLNKHYKNVMESADPEAFISREIMQEAIGDPALAEVYGRLAQVNADLWGSVRANFFGNPARSNIERVLNSYLLFWPISYQIKSTKWMMRVLFDRVGGIKTNAAGAYGLDQLQSAHVEAMANDPEYRRFIDEHPNALFVAQMLFPMTPWGMGVSLSPVMRNILFARSRNLLEIGPVYTATRVIPGVVGELANDLSGVPGMDIVGAMAGVEAKE